jgi:putative membrane protein
VRSEPPATERARDHLANERTFLAWLRTALAVIALGAVLAKLRSPHDATTAAAVAIVSACGVVVLVYGALRYYAVARNLDAGRFEPTMRSPALITLAVVVATAIVVPLLLS